ncbi:hypothetical protein O3M35_001394 [Rhynocoris fuscipes]|uniref:Uncharacterized protein n=1 Tax=Rhynocoris fuscipes TaxID=488301 RepID=A0AAW1CR88_9HEMI
MKKAVELKGPPDEEDIFLKVHYSDESALPNWQLQYIDGAASVLLEPVAWMEQLEHWLSQQHVSVARSLFFCALHFQGNEETLISIIYLKIGNH